jgi:hypothetical protein
VFFSEKRTFPLPDVGASRGQAERLITAARTPDVDGGVQAQARDILFALEFAVHRNECIDMSARTAEEFAIFHARPAQALNGNDVVA